MDTSAVMSECGGFDMSWAARSDVGKVRKVNEDGWFAAPGIFVVADGMGGHAAGDIASKLTVSTFVDMVWSPPVSITELPTIVQDANRRVVEHALGFQREGMGSTLVAAAIVDNGSDTDLVVLNVGDSRCYLFEADRLVRITHDHSHVQELVDNGEITEAEAAVHPSRNVVTRAIGIEHVVTADYVVVPVEGAVRLMLCSDGVHGEVGEESLHDILAEHTSPAAAVDAVINRVLQGRAADNATVVVVDLVRLVAHDADDLDAQVARRIASFHQFVGELARA